MGTSTVRRAKLGIHVRTVGSENLPKAWLGVPMIAGDRVMGALVVQHPDDEYAYDQDDLNVLQAIANQIGIALSGTHSCTRSPTCGWASAWKS